MTNSVYSFLGLATKAGKVVSGEDTCERAAKSNKANLLIVASDASDNTRKKFYDICKYRNINIRVFGKKEQLGKYIGKDIRSVIAICGKEFSQKLMEMIDNYSRECGGEQFGEG